MPIKSKDRAEELNRLVVEQGIVTRNWKYGAPVNEERERIDARAARMIELVELLEAHVNAPGYEGEEITPERYVNDRIAAWMRANPLPLAQDRLINMLDDSGDNGVYVRIGEDDKRYEYRFMADDCTVSGMGQLVLKVPESVAEYFRQQGRRQLQRSIRNDLGI